jgi:DNA repair photolyase
MQALFPLESLGQRLLPTVESIGAQKDIRYYGTRAKGLLNTPEATRMGFWSINPYVGCAFGCAYCYARYTHGYVAERAVAAAPDATYRDELTELPPWLAFERRIFVKQNAADVLREQLRAGLASRSESALKSRLGKKDSKRGRSPARLTGLWQGESIAIGTATDPYQPAERKYRVTRGVLEVLAEERGLSIGITTKSPLITRDVDVLARITARSKLTIHVSLITVDRDLARRIEPRAPTPEARLRAIARLAQSGIDVGVNIMPVLPGLTDRPEMLDALVRGVAQTGARYVNACALRLQAAARRRYLPFIAQEFPHLAERYRAAYAEGYQLGDRYREGLRSYLRQRCRIYGVRYGMVEETEDVRHESERTGVGAGEEGEQEGPGRSTETDSQLELGLDVMVDETR